MSKNPSGLGVGRTGLRLSGDNPVGVSISELVSARKLRPDRIRLMEDIQYEISAWRQAKTREAFAKALDEQLPDKLQALWDHGIPMYGEGTLETRAERRQALLSHWSTRACSPEGDAAAERIALFLEREVGESEHPMTAAEVRHAEHVETCDRVLKLGE